MGNLKLGETDISHERLSELAKLADQALPFYEFIEERFQEATSSKKSLHDILMSVKKAELKKCIKACYDAPRLIELPSLFDGIGRSYPHSKACFYFLAWMLRDAPQQRLAPLIARIRRNTGDSALDVEMNVLAELAIEYRSVIKSFNWEAVREVVIDRLEGSRRSIKGHEKEVVVRTAFATAIQTFYAAKKSYGEYHKVEVSVSQIKIGSETYDVSIALKSPDGQIVRRILAPVKTRETEGGGHAHLFSRDITKAIDTVRKHNPNDFVVTVIVAKNWSQRETEEVERIVDLALVFEMSPNEFKSFEDKNQKRLNDFIAKILTQKVLPKKA